MEVKIEVIDLRSQIFFVIYGEAVCKSLAFYINFKDQTQPVEKCRIALYVELIYLPFSRNTTNILFSCFIK